jgi:hypothetical protein
MTVTIILQQPGKENGKNLYIFNKTDFFGLKGPYSAVKVPL